MLAGCAGTFAPLTVDPVKEVQKTFDRTLHKLPEGEYKKFATMWRNIFEHADTWGYDSICMIDASDSVTLRSLILAVGKRVDAGPFGRPDTPQLEWLDSIRSWAQYCDSKSFGTRAGGRWDKRSKYVIIWGPPAVYTFDPGDCFQVKKSEYVPTCIIYTMRWDGNTHVYQFQAKADGLPVEERPTEDDEFASESKSDAHYRMNKHIRQTLGQDSVPKIDLSEGAIVLTEDDFKVSTSVFPSGDSSSLVVSAFGIRLEKFGVDSLTHQRRIHIEVLVRDTSYDQALPQYISRSWAISQEVEWVPLACTTRIVDGKYLFAHTVRDDVAKCFGSISTEVHAPTLYASLGSSDLLFTVPGPTSATANRVEIGRSQLQVLPGRILRLDQPVSVFLQVPRGIANEVGRFENEVFINLTPIKESEIDTINFSGPTYLDSELPKSQVLEKSVRDAIMRMIGNGLVYSSTFAEDGPFWSNTIDISATFSISPDERKKFKGWQKIRAMVVSNGLVYWAYGYVKLI
ncbi:MAG: hypothetical protein WC289_02095 [Patescibacteria group bacterium]|jgi:hypothetical protein